MLRIKPPPALLSAIALLLAAQPVAGQSLLVDSLMHAGIQRRYTVHLPSGYSESTPVPLVLNLHGGGGTMVNAQGFTQMNSVSQAEGFLLVYPQGAAPTLNGFSWADGRGTPADLLGIDDVGFIARLLDTLATHYAIATDRIYACGFSNGGFMTQRLACELAERFAAIGSLGCSMDTVLFTTCQPSRPVPMMLVAGTDDPEVPYEGGAMSNPLVTPIVPVDSMVAFWAARNQCGSSPVTVKLPDLVTDDGSTVQRTDFSGCACNADVRFYRVEGGGHTWPGVEIPFLEPQLGQTNEDIEASEELWAFFADHALCFTTGEQESRTRPAPAPYPVPFHHRLHMGIPSGSEREMLVLDALGRPVARTRAMTIDTSDWPTGFYTVVLLERGVLVATARTMKQ